MTLYVLAWLGGVLTILSPCILPVLPFVFARAGQPFLRSVLPMLSGMAAAFAGIATLAALGGGWAVQANQYGRYAALALLALFGATLLFPAFADRLMQPLVAAGARLSASAGDGRHPAVLPSLVLGVATGLLWSPCAGPILGLILTGAALKGASAGTATLLFAYGLGAATSLAAALLLGGRVLAGMRRSLAAGEWVRRGLGLAVLVGVAAIALGVDTGLLTRLSLAGTTGLEQRVLARLRPQAAPAAGTNSDDDAERTTMTQRAPGAAPSGLPDEGAMPPLDGAVQWLNTAPLSAAALRGKVVLIDFWTYSCINCLRTLPYLRAWADRYRDQGLVVIGVHAPEFAFEKNIANVKRAVQALRIGYPVAIDNDYAIWRAFGNEYWPAHYFIDAQGRIRYHHFGEGEYEQSEQVIRELLREAGRDVSGGFVHADAAGITATGDLDQVASPETYIGYARAENFDSPEGQVHDARHRYTEPAAPALNHWGLAGEWTLGEERVSLDAAPGAIVYRFHARDLHLVLGPGAGGRPVRFRVTLDGKPPGADHGVDTDADGYGQIDSQRLYQLIRQSGTPRDRNFRIEFLDPGVEAYSFTFG